MERIGRYRVLGILGGGGMATVYRAEHPVLEQTVAVKVLHPHLAADPGFVARFRQEAGAIASLRHQNIVRWLDFDTDNDTCFMVLEYIDGPTLQAFLRDRATGGPRLSTAEILTLLSPLAAALDYAHARGFVHRDLKPANVLLTSAGEPVITDFGIARILDQTGMTQSGVVMGSAHYMSPEQIQGHEVDGRSDLYSLGIMLFEMLTGRLPFDGDTTGAIMAKHLTEPVPSAYEIDHGLPAGIDAVLRRLLAKAPEERYGSGAELVRDVEAVFARTPAMGVAPPPAADSATRVEIAGVPEAGGRIDAVQATPTRPGVPPAVSPGGAAGWSAGPAWIGASGAPGLDMPAGGVPTPGRSPARRGRLVAVLAGVGVVLVAAAVVIVVLLNGRPTASTSTQISGSTSTATTTTSATTTATTGATSSSSTATTSATTSTTLPSTTTITGSGPGGSFAVGDTGPAGGIIIHDKGGETGGWRYLEAAPSSTEWADVRWGQIDTPVTGADGTKLGSGRQNTADIVAAQGSGDTYAAQLCDSLVHGGFDDWYLPSKDELNLIYEIVRTTGEGGFTAAGYWSSSEYSADVAWFQDLGGGSQRYFSKLTRYRVRAVRSF